MFVVGPESAGAHPGPVCYRKSIHCFYDFNSLYLLKNLLKIAFSPCYSLIYLHSSML